MNQYFLFIEITISLLIVLVILSVLFPNANIFYQILMLTSNKKIEFGSEYFRDILSYSPSEVYYIYKKNFKYSFKYDRNGYLSLIQRYRKLFLINLLKMELLGYIDIDFTKKKNFKIIRKDVFILDTEYNFLNNFIFKYITSENEITLYELYDFINKNINDKHFKKWDEIIQMKISRRGFVFDNFGTFYDDKIKFYYKISLIISLILYAFFLSILDIRTAGAILIGLPCFFTIEYNEAKRLKVMSSNGFYEHKKIKALKKFLKDFSIIDERGPEYSQILEDYVVYANIFNLQKIK